MAYSLYLWHWPLLIFWLCTRVTTRAGTSRRVILLVSVLAWLTTRYIEEPLRAQEDLGAGPQSCLRARLRRPTIVLGSVVALLGVALTATSFTWREHVHGATRQLTELSGFCRRRTTRHAAPSQPCECPAADAADHVA